MKKIIVPVFLISIVSYLLYNYFNSSKIEENVLYGNVEIKEVNLSFQVSGRLLDMKFDEGDKISKGDLLAVIDDKPYKIKLSQTKALLKKANVTFNNALLVYKRHMNLCKNDIFSKQDCDNIKMKKEEAEANLEYSKTLYEEAKNNLEYTNLYSPSDGIVITKIVENGTILSPMNPVYTLSLLDKVFIRAFIEENILGKIKLGQKVKIFTDSNNEYEGTIGFISPIAEFTPKNIETPSLRTSLVYRIRINVDNSDDFLKQGMPVTIKIEE